MRPTRELRVPTFAVVAYISDFAVALLTSLRAPVHVLRSPMINLILFGPPGSGKGTQALRLAEEYKLVHISTGDLFRAEITGATPLGIEAKRYMDAGQLVPDTVTIGMFRSKLEGHADAAGFIYDGFPRTVAQAQALDHLLANYDAGVDLLIALDVDEDEITRRLLDRGATSGRADDRDEATIRKRYQVYLQQTTPVFDYYDGHGKAVRVIGVGEINHVYAALCEAIDQIGHGEEV